MTEELKDFHVRLPKDVCDQLPIARMRTGKKIQDFVRDALEGNLKRLNL